MKDLKQLKGWQAAKKTLSKENVLADWFFKNGFTPTLKKSEFTCHYETFSVLVSVMKILILVSINITLYEFVYNLVIFFNQTKNLRFWGSR